MMNRQEYLEFARLAQFGADSLDLAKIIVTAEDVKSATEQVEREIRKTYKTALWANRLLTPGGLVLAALFGVAAVALNSYAGHPVHSGLYVAGVICAIVAGFWFAISVSVTHDTRVSMLQELEPIAGTEACMTALQVIQAGRAEVLAWRDLAIAERGQLHRFDVVVMRCLDYQAKTVQRLEEEALNRAAWEAKQKRELEEACRLVHGI